MNIDSNLIAEAYRSVRVQEANEQFNKAFLDGVQSIYKGFKSIMAAHGLVDAKNVAMAEKLIANIASTNSAVNKDTLLEIIKAAASIQDQQQQQPAAAPAPAAPAPAAPAAVSASTTAAPAPAAAAATPTA